MSSIIDDFTAIRDAMHGPVPSGDGAPDGDPLVAMWAERNRLDALAAAADREWRAEDRDALDDQRFAIEEKMSSIHATTIGGALAQIELLQLLVPSESKTLLWTLHAGLLAMRAREPSAVDPAASDGDAAILAKFREWCAARRAFDADPGNDALWDRIVDIEKALVAIPASGTVGLSLKGYILLNYDDDDHREDLAAMSGYMVEEGDGDGQDMLLKREFLRDAVRFVPELGPLCVAVFGREARP